MIKELIKNNINTIVQYYSNKDFGIKQLSSIITYLFSIFGKDEASKAFLIEKFKNHTDVYEYVLTYMDNPSCTCRTHIAFFIEKNLSVGLEILFEIIDVEKNEKLLEIVKNASLSFKESVENNEYGLYGKIIQIENSKEEYLKILKEYNEDPRYKYKGLQIIKTEDGKFLDLYFY